MPPYNHHYVAHRKRTNLLRLLLTVALTGASLLQLVQYLAPPPQQSAIATHAQIPITLYNALLAQLDDDSVSSPPPLDSALADLIESRLNLTTYDDDMTDRAVTLLWAPYSLRDFALNWACHAQRVAVTNYVFVVEEDMMYVYLEEIGEPVYRISGVDGLHRVGDGPVFFDDSFSPEGRDQTRRKVDLVSQVLRAGYTVLISDIANIWLSNPFPHLSSPALSYSDVIGTPDPEIGALTMDFLYLRPTTATLGLWSSFAQALTLCAAHHLSAPSLLNLLLENPLHTFRAIDYQLSPTLFASARETFDAPSGVFPGERGFPMVLRNDWYGNADTRQNMLEKNGFWRVEDVEEGICSPVTEWVPTDDAEMWPLVHATDSLFDDMVGLSPSVSNPASSPMPFDLHMHVLTTGDNPAATQRFIDTLLLTTASLSNSTSRAWTISLHFVVRPTHGVYASQPTVFRLMTTLNALSMLQWPHGAKTVVVANSSATMDGDHLADPARVWVPQTRSEALMVTTDEVAWQDGWIVWLKEVVENRWLCHVENRGDIDNDRACQYDERAYGVSMSVESIGRQVMQFYRSGYGEEGEDDVEEDDELEMQDPVAQVVKSQAWSPHAQVFFPYAWARFTRFVERVRDDEQSAHGAWVVDRELETKKTDGLRRFPVFAGAFMPELELAGGKGEEEQVEGVVREYRRGARVDMLDATVKARENNILNEHPLSEWYALFSSFVGLHGLHSYAPHDTDVSAEGSGLVIPTTAHSGLGTLTLDDLTRAPGQLDPHARTMGRSPYAHTTVYDFRWRPMDARVAPLHHRDWAVRWTSWSEVRARVEAIRKAEIESWASSEEAEWTRICGWIVPMSCIVVGFVVVWLCCQIGYGGVAEMDPAAEEQV
ncbi:hypothetical protein BC936DRAFT_139662 [Jimgerdemannia flammicorona]|uniref:Nucleotide-diphospho-sugar transferase domain-containing protein n=1 Tax=Jimgerdemannia flammicorona TaxID=994334 RepID=A0A433B9F7_9FUNG|nr:hypothetical protein BC936DRAFT_139662 [Jimgerdemannia flammicorona]